MAGRLTAKPKRNQAGRHICFPAFLFLRNLLIAAAQKLSAVHLRRILGIDFRRWNRMS
jgi:hypothetical protein